MADMDWKQQFIDLFEDIAACEAPPESQVDHVLSKFQAAFDKAAGIILYCDYHETAHADRNHVSAVCKIRVTKERE